MKTTKEKPNKNKRHRLISIGPEKLADALMELAMRDDTANDMVERMTATPTENMKRFKMKLAGLKRMKRFVRWSESAALARELEALLEDLKAAVDNPKAGAELSASFYETDKAVLGNCDDSSGHVGDVYRHDAKELFVSYASRCDDKEWLGDMVFKLNQKNDYGVRDTLIHCAAEYLPEAVMRSIVERLWARAEHETGEYEERDAALLISSLARQLKDAPLYEKAYLAAFGKLSTAACVDIAEICLDAGDAQEALSWLERIDPAETFQADERDELLMAIYEKLGNPEKREETAWRIFKRHRSADTLGTLLSVIGNDQQEKVVEEETRNILQSEGLSYSDAEFLIDIGRAEDANDYLLASADQLNGDLYGSLLPMAEAMERAGYRLAACAIYRALLDSILERGKSKYYHHGVRYLKKLDSLSKAVADWGSFKTHDAYVAYLRETHGRKTSFWARYEE